jgi:hypothetical protein
MPDIILRFSFGYTTSTSIRDFPAKNRANRLKLAMLRRKNLVLGGHGDLRCYRVGLFLVR